MKTKLLLGCILLAAMFVACKNSEKPVSEQEYVKDWETEGVALGLTPTEYENMTPEELKLRHQIVILAKYCVYDDSTTIEEITDEYRGATITISEDEAEALGVSRSVYREQVAEIERESRDIIAGVARGENITLGTKRGDSLIGNRELLLEAEKFYTKEQ